MATLTVPSYRAGGEEQGWGQAGVRWQEPRDGGAWNAAPSVHTILISTQRSTEKDDGQSHRDLVEHGTRALPPSDLLDAHTISQDHSGENSDTLQTTLLYDGACLSEGVWGCAVPSRNIDNVLPPMQPPPNPLAPAKSVNCPAPLDRTSR